MDFPERRSSRPMFFCADRDRTLRLRLVRLVHGKLLQVLPVDPGRTLEHHRHGLRVGTFLRVCFHAGWVEIMVRFRKPKYRNNNDEPKRR